MRRPHKWLRRTRPMRIWYVSRVTGHSAGVDGPSGSYSCHSHSSRNTRTELIAKALAGYRRIRDGRK